ncbi:MAG: alpha-glucan family phosphorylase, partial [Poseidonia sp.]
MPPIAYFTAEIGLWSELHTYSGGLGVLAGDHVKSAADARLPLVGMSLLYREGYGRQHLDEAGDQSESYAPIDPAEHLTNTGKTIQLPLDGETLFATIWKTDVVGVSGHVVPVYFLDTAHPNNTSSFVGLGAR